MADLPRVEDTVPTETGTVTENQSAGLVTEPVVRHWVMRHWHLLLLGILIVAQLAVNWAWLRTNVVLLGWDRPRHLIESLVYNDILRQLSLRSLFEGWVHSGYYPPLFHWAMVSFYGLFGVSMDVAASVNSVFLILLVVAAYGIGSRIGGKGVGLLSAFITSTSPMIFGMSRYTYIEFSLTAMATLSIWLMLLSQEFSSKRYSLLFGLSAGLGLLTKWTFSLFVFPALLIVILRAGVLSDMRGRVRSVRLDRRWAVVSALTAAVLTLIWYLPNLDRAAELPLGYLLVPISWFLIGGLVYILRQPASNGWNTLGSLWLCLVVAGSWYLPRIDFVNHTFLIAWGRPERQSWAFQYYLNHLTNEHLSLLYMALLILVGIGLLALALRALRREAGLREMLSSDFLLLLVWVVVPYLVFSFRPSSKHSRFIMPILPALGMLMAYGLSRIRWTRVRLASIALVVLLGTSQWLALSFDSLQWLRDAAVVGEVNAFAHMFQNQLPNQGETDSGYWVVPEMLRYLSDRAAERGQPVELALLVNTRQVHDEHFLYLIYTDFPNVKLRELAQNWTGRPAYPQLWEVDYVAVPSANPPHKLDAASLEVVDMLLERPPVLFREAFGLIGEYPLPDDNTIYLYERTYALPEGYEAEQYEALAEELDGHLGHGDTLLLHPVHQVALLGRYYAGQPDLLLPTFQGTNDDEIIQVLEEALEGGGRVVTVFESGRGEDVQSIIGPWLSERCFIAVDGWYGPAKLTLYACDPGQSSQDASVEVNADFEGQIRLLSHTALPPRIVAGEILPLTFTWQAQTQMEKEYKIFIHLLAGEAVVVAQQDSGPEGGWRPTSGWREGELIGDNHGLLIPEALPTGGYGLVAGLYDADGDRLMVLDEHGREAGDSLVLGSLQVVSR